MKNKLIIWDFDGVIADTEKLWLINRMNMLNSKFNLDWNITTINKYIGGMADKTKRKVLDNLGIITDDSFWKKALEEDKKNIKNGFALTDNIKDIFKLTSFDQCIATGGIKSKTKDKIKTVGIEKIFTDKNVFTVDMVEKGKPEPDIFLLAAKTMGYKPEDCIVIEDSIAGITAAIKANMEVVAFVKYSFDKENYIKQLKELGIKNIFDNMIDIKNFILKKAL